MTQVVLRVAGMDCTGCEARIQKALNRLEGIRQATANYQTGEVRVAFDPAHTSETAIRACIQQAGYEVPA